MKNPGASCRFRWMFVRRVYEGTINGPSRNEKEKGR